MVSFGAFWRSVYFCTNIGSAFANLQLDTVLLNLSPSNNNPVTLPSLFAYLIRPVAATVIQPCCWVHKLCTRWEGVW
jgi:hypothetical protein